MRVKVRGRYWELVRRRMPREIDGSCDHPHALGKQIRIRKGLPTFDDLRVLLHELIHAGAWDLDEEVVDELSTDIARVLLADGWRKA